MSKYAPGQVWTYRTRPGEESSRITILKVDQHDKLGNIIHIHVSNVAIKSPSAPDGVAKVIHHSPYTEKAIDDSVLELGAENVELPDFQEGYDTWKEAFDKSEAGVFSISVSEGVAAMEQVLSGNP